MPKTSKEQIKRDERKIISLLQSDAGQSIDSIAKKCGFSRQKVWRIIKRLEENGTIWGYTAVTDNAKTEVERFIVLIKRTTQPVKKDLVERIIKRDIEEMAKKANLEINLENSYFVNGVYDWVITFTARNLTEAKKFCEKINTAYDGYIAELQLLEEVFPVKTQGIINPNVEDLKNFITG
ncbi:MAG TPA: Lrp/AsnC family transcriptional regulator [Thermoplasmatales archaeon]|nr:Lrp/AsnC family transcriptional regulator [Thermoplasmatales archaeon]